MAKPRKSNDTTANLGFEAKLWATADALRNNMDAAEYKHVLAAKEVLDDGERPRTEAYYVSMVTDVDGKVGVFDHLR